MRDEPGAGAEPAAPEPLGLLVCRGCCCGTEEKHPGIDHPGHPAAVRAAAAARTGAYVSTVGCLTSCESSNVIVVRGYGAEGTRTRWLGEMSDDALVAELAAWVAAGHGNADALPPALAAHVFRDIRGPVHRGPIPTGAEIDEDD